MRLKINVFTDNNELFHNIVKSLLGDTKFECANYLEIGKRTVKSEDFVIQQAALNDSSRGIKGHFSIVDADYRIKQVSHCDMSSYFIHCGMYMNKDFLLAMSFMDRDMHEYNNYRGKEFRHDNDFSLIRKAIGFVIMSNKYFGSLKNEN